MKLRRYWDYAPLISSTHSVNLRNMSSTSSSTTKSLLIRKISRLSTYSGKTLLMRPCLIKVVSKNTYGITSQKMKYLTIISSSTWQNQREHRFAAALMVVKILGNAPVTRKITSLSIQRTIRFCRQGVEKWSLFRQEQRIALITRYSVTMSATLAAAAIKTCAWISW